MSDLDDWYSKNGYNTRKLADYLAEQGFRKGES